MVYKCPECVRRLEVKVSLVYSMIDRASPVLITKSLESSIFLHLRHNSHDVVGAHTCSARWAVCLHVVRALLGELDRHGGILAVVGAKLSMNTLARGGINGKVIDVCVISGEWYFICKKRIISRRKMSNWGGRRTLDGFADFGGLGAAHDQELGLIDVTEERVKHMLFVGDGLAAVL